MHGVFHTGDNQCIEHSQISDKFHTGDTSTYRTLTTVFAMIGKFGIAASFAVIYIFSAELLPTVIR